MKEFYITAAAAADDGCRVCYNVFVRRVYSCGFLVCFFCGLYIGVVCLEVVGNYLFIFIAYIFVS